VLVDKDLKIQWIERELGFPLRKGKWVLVSRRRCMQVIHYARLRIKISWEEEAGPGRKDNRSCAGCLSGQIARQGSSTNSAAFLVCSVTEGALLGQSAH